MPPNKMPEVLDTLISCRQAFKVEATSDPPQGYSWCSRTVGEPVKRPTIFFFTTTAPTSTRQDLLPTQPAKKRCWWSQVLCLVGISSTAVVVLQFHQVANTENFTSDLCLEIIDKNLATEQAPRTACDWESTCRADSAHQEADLTSVTSHQHSQ